MRDFAVVSLFVLVTAAGTAFLVVPDHRVGAWLTFSAFLAAFGVVVWYVTGKTPR